MISTSPTGRSNCLLIALVAWARDPLGTRIRMQRSDFGGPHFYWVTRYGRAMHWTSSDQHLPAWRTAWFAGRVARFPLRAARRAERRRAFRASSGATLTLRHASGSAAP